MIKLSIFYPNTGKFDMDYYLNTHMPRSIALLSQGKGYRGVSVERGLGGAAPGSAPAYVAMCHYCSTAPTTSWQHSCHTPQSCRETCRTTPTSKQ